MGLGFSAVAEGYLNARMFGVFIHGLIIGMLAALIRYFQFSGRFGMYGVFFYSALLAGFYKIYQQDFTSILSRFEWNILGTLFLICLVTVMSGAARKKRYDP